MVHCQALRPSASTVRRPRASRAAAEPSLHGFLYVQKGSPPHREACMGRREAEQALRPAPGPTQGRKALTHAPSLPAASPPLPISLAVCLR